MRAAAPILAEAVKLAEEFAALVRGRKPERSDPWLQAAVVMLRRRTRGSDAGLEQHGQVEGRINRLKTLKHQIYGRANLDLLERRFVLAA